MGQPAWIKRSKHSIFRKSSREIKAQRENHLKHLEQKTKNYKRDINLLTFDELKKIIFKKEV